MSYTEKQLESVTSYVRIRRIDGELDALAKVSCIPAFKLGKLADGSYLPTTREIELLERIQDRGAAGLIPELPLFAPREDTRTKE